MRRERVLTAICLLLMATAAGGQNLVVNGDFDVGIEGWEAQSTPPGMTGEITARHDPGIDALGAPGSGSLALDWDLAVPPSGPPPVERTTVLQTNCTSVTIAPDAGLLPIGWSAEGLAAEAGDAAIYLCQSEAPDCSGAVFCTVDVLPTTPGFIFDDGLAPPNPTVGTQGVFARVDVAFEPGGGGGFVAQGSVRLDKVYLREDVQPDLTAAIELLGTAGLTASFGGSSLGGQSPFQRVFNWDFGDGASSDEQNPAHSYSSPGTYLVTLVVDSGFSQAVDQFEVTVTGSATAIPTVSSVGLAVLAVILGLGGIILLRSRGLFPGS